MNKFLTVTKALLIFLICALTVSGADNFAVTEISAAVLYSEPAGPAKPTEPQPAESEPTQSEAAVSEAPVKTEEAKPSAEPKTQPPKKAAASKSEAPVVKVNLSAEKRAVWISFLEYKKILNGKSENQFKKFIDTYLDNCAQYGINTVIVQARSHSDAYYKSSYYPASVWFTTARGNNFPFDPLSVMIEAAHKRGMKIEAWVNPYRGNKISESFAENDIIKSWLNTDKVFSDSEYYYLNPGEPEVINYVTAGVMEIVENYDVDGIHFDDYFYPSSIGTADSNTYAAYGGGKTLAEFRTESVSRLVSGIYGRIKSVKNITFGISPAGNIDNCLKKNYADVVTWGKSTGYVDYLAPQIYWDYGQQPLPYGKALEKWKKTVTNGSVSLIVGLAPYRIEQSDGSRWNAGDILKRQVSDARTAANYGGFIMFRYEHFFSDKLKTERDNLKSILG